MTVRNDMKYSLMNLSGFKIDLIDAPWAKVFDFVAHAKPGTDKKALPLIKLARFGVQPSPQKGNLRHDANVLSIFGLEGDYDGEVMTPRAAVALLEQFGIRAAVVTSFSHDPARPRWRVLCPLSKPFNPGARRALMGRLNGALTGVLSNESFTLSQAFFIGGRVGGVYEALHTFEDPEDGRCIDELDELDDIAMMPERDKREDRGPAELVTLPADKFEELRQALSVIDSDERWQWVRIGHALHHLGEDGFTLFDEWSQKSDKYDAADCRERWDGFSGARATYKTVFKEAYRCGWAGPERRMPEPPPMEDVPLEAYEHGSVWERPLGPAFKAAEPPKPWPFERVDSANAVMTAPPPIEWFVHERIQMGRGMLLTGVGGSSKTRVLYHTAIGGTVGSLPWGWQVERTGSSVLVLTEDTPGDVHQTLWSTCRGMGLSEADRRTVGEKVHLFALAGHECRLLELDRSTGAMRQTALVGGLEALVREIGDVVFIGLDPALSLTTGDENDQGHQRALGKLVDDLAVRTGAAVMLVSHASKASLSKDELDSHNSRGGGAITDAVRGEFSARTMTAKEAREFGITDMEERKRLVQLACTKGNHLPPSAFVPIWLHRGDGGCLSAANLERTAPGEAPVIGRRELAAFAALQEIAYTETPTMAKWTAVCVGRGIVAGTPETARKSLQRLRDKLIAAGMVESGVKTGTYVPTEGRENDE